MKILLAKPRGFCAGVDRAVTIVNLALERYGPPVYVKHEIVHNTRVVERLRNAGAVFVESIEDIPEGANAVFSAHGSPPSDYDRAKELHLNLIDSVCPLVTKVHMEARRYSREGLFILLIGHRGHVEVEGTMKEAPEHTVCIESAEEARTVTVPDTNKVACLTQTTLSVDDTKEIIEILTRRFPSMVLPPSADICYATTNRQAAVRKLAEQSDCVLVVGSPRSSNSNRLREVAEIQGVRAYLIDRAEDIQSQWLDGVDTVGITAGASAPEDLVQEVISLLQRSYRAENVEELYVVDESITFPLPDGMR